MSAFYLTQDSDGRWYWRLVSNTGAELARGNPVKRKGTCEEALDRFMVAVTSAARIVRPIALRPRRRAIIRTSNEERAGT